MILLCVPSLVATAGYHELAFEYLGESFMHSLAMSSHPIWSASDSISLEDGILRSPFISKSLKVVIPVIAYKRVSNPIYNGCLESCSSEW